MIPHDMKAHRQEQLAFTNEFKIRFCNGYHALARHIGTCSKCHEYLCSGDGDLCDSGKWAIAKAMVLQYTTDRSMMEKNQLNPVGASKL